MSNFISQLLFPFSMILGLISGIVYPPYIQLGAESLTFDYKTGDFRPAYLLSVKNMGSQKARFDISSNVDWIFITQEGQDNVRSIQLDVQNTVNFVLDIRTDLVYDGQYSGELTVNAVENRDQSIIDTKKVSVTLNRNFVPAPTVTPALSAGEMPAETPVMTTTTTPSVSTVISSTASVSPAPIPPKTPAPSIRVSPSASVKAEPTKLVSPSDLPEAREQTDSTSSRQAVAPEKANKSVWQRIADWFSKIF